MPVHMRTRCARTHLHTYTHTHARTHTHTHTHTYARQSSGSENEAEADMDESAAIIWNAYVDACDVLERWIAAHATGLRALGAAAGAREAMEAPSTGAAPGAAASAACAAAPTPRAAAYASPAAAHPGVRARSPACAAGALDTAGTSLRALADSLEADLDELRGFADEAIQALADLPVEAEAEAQAAEHAHAHARTLPLATADGPRAPHPHPHTPHTPADHAAALPPAATSTPLSPAACALRPEPGYALPAPVSPLQLALTLAATADALGADCAMKCAIARDVWAHVPPATLRAYEGAWELQPHVADGALERVLARGELLARARPRGAKSGSQGGS